MQRKGIYGVIQPWIMTVTDHSTGFMYCVACSNKTSDYVSHELEKILDLSAILIFCFLLFRAAKKQDDTTTSGKAIMSDAKFYHRTFTCCLPTECSVRCRWKGPRNPNCIGGEASKGSERYKNDDRGGMN